jgi:hypothetical protein
LVETKFEIYFYFLFSWFFLQSWYFGTLNDCVKRNLELIFNKQ